MYFGYCFNVARFRVRFKEPPRMSDGRVVPHSDEYWMCAPCYDLAMESGKYVDIDAELC